MHEDPSPQGSARLAVTIGALGVVFGDIWTSPLYTIQTIFSTDGSQPIALTRASVYGLISMVVWSVTIIVTLKCVLLVMRADNDGKRGILALIIPISRGPHRGGRRTALVLAALGIFGAALFFGGEGVGELGGPGPVLIGVQDDAAAGGAEAGGEVQDAGGCSGLRGT